MYNIISCIVYFRSELHMNEWWNLEVIQYYMKIAETKNITIAAKELFITQPSLSHQLKNIETRLGVELYSRASKGIVLTPEGEQFYNQCKELMAAYDKFVIDAHQLVNDVVGTIRIGYPKAGEEFLIKYNHMFIQNYPDVTIRNLRQTRDNFITKVAGGELDLFFAHELDFANAPAGISSMTIGRNPFMVLVSSDNPLAQKDSVHFSELKNYKFVTPSRQHAAGRVDRLMRAGKENGFTPKIIGSYYQQSDYNVDILTSKNIISVQSFLPNLEREYDYKLKFVPLEGYEQYDTICLIWSKDNMNPLIPLYVKTIKASLDQDNIQ